MSILLLLPHAVHHALQNHVRAVALQMRMVLTCPFTAESAPGPQCVLHFKCSSVAASCIVLSSVYSLQELWK